MKEETKVELIRLSVQLTTELVRDGKGHLARLIEGRALNNRCNVLDVFDVIHAHLSQSISKE